MSFDISLIDSCKFTMFICEHNEQIDSSGNALHYDVNITSCYTYVSSLTSHGMRRNYDAFLVRSQLSLALFSSMNRRMSGIRLASSIQPGAYSVTGNLWSP